MDSMEVTEGRWRKRPFIFIDVDSSEKIHGLVRQMAENRSDWTDEAVFGTIHAFLHRGMLPVRDYERLLLRYWKSPSVS